MKDVVRRVFSVFLVFFCFLILSAKAFSQDPITRPTSRILLIHSYHQEYPWVQAVTEGVKASLKGKPVDLDIFYMDTKRHTSRDWMMARGQKAREKIAEFRPDVVITADDNAQAFVTRHYLNKRPFFVFCGVNGNPEDYGFPADNVTGILERPFINQSLALLQEIVPSVKSVSVVSDPGQTSIGALTYIRKNIQGIRVLDYKIIGDFFLWKQRILEFNHTVDALVFYTYHTIKGKTGAVSVDPETVMGWTRENIKIPSVGLLDFAVRDGALCGVVESGYEHGFEAAEMALRILSGEDPKGILVRTARKGIRMVNLKTARNLGIVVRDKVLNSIDVVIDEK